MSFLEHRENEFAPKKQLRVIFSEGLCNLDCAKIKDMYTDMNVIKEGSMQESEFKWL